MMRRKVIDNNWSFFVICITLFALFLVGISPVGAVPTNTALPLDNGQAVYLGEKNVALSANLVGHQVGFFNTTSTTPVVTVTLGSPSDSFTTDVHPELSGNYGPWYFWDGVNRGAVAFVLVQPSMSAIISDTSALCSLDRTGTTVMNSQDLQFKVSIEQLVFSRSTAANRIRYDINLTDGKQNYPVIPDNVQLINQVLTADPTLVGPWNTDALDGNGQYKTPTGKYTFYASCVINDLPLTSPEGTVTLEKPSVTLSISPETIQRGMNATVSFKGEPNTAYYFAIIECPLRMSGEICDRPPYILPNSAINGTLNPSGMTGNEPMVPNCCGGMPFDSAVLNGNELNPPDGFSRMALVTTDCYGDASFLVGSNADTWKKNVDPIYTLHVQKVNSEADGTILYDQASLTLTKGSVSIQFYLASDPDQTPITEAFLGDLIGIKGTNTESGTTFLYMTGPCQPACGGSLLPTPYPFGPLGPGPDQVTVIGGSWTFVTPGFNPPKTWWDTSVLPINPGNYTIYALSGWPNPATCPGNTANCQRVSCGGGTCQLLNCPNCLVYSAGTITLKKPTLEAHVNDIERCCCPGTACGTTLDLQNITVVGNVTGNTPYNNPVTGVLTKDAVVWVFGKGKVGPEKFLNWHQAIPCDGVFNFTIPLVDRNGQAIPLCSLDAGTYDVIIQTHGYNQRYDVMWEGDTLGEIWSGGVPMEQNKEWIVTSYPTNSLNSMYKPFPDHPDYPTYSKLVQVEGPGYKMGTEALNGLIKGLENPDIDDQYVHIQFTIKNKACLSGTDFDADRTYGNLPLTVRFTDMSGGSPGSWAWDFGDGNKSVEQNPVHTYTSEGRFTVTLVTDGNEKNKAVKNELIRVAEGPMAAFNTMPEDIIAGSQVQFIDLSTGNPSSWFWEFGDGGSSPLQSPVYVYARPGSYTVKLTVSDGNGISQTASKVVTVSGSQTPIEANFNTKMKGSATVEFTDLSTGYGINSWAWNFGDGSASSEQNPTHIYEKEGTYNVTLTVSNGDYDATVTKTIGIS